jgi:general secretion pathway protein G
VNRFAHHRRTFRRGDRGMTLIEIMVVITILGLIAAAVGVAVVPQLQKAKIDRAKMDIGNVQNALKLYYTQKGKYPDTGDGLQALVTGKQLEALPVDPWGGNYIYILENGKPVVTTYGSDGAPGGEDDAADISSKDLEKTATAK